MKKTILLLTLYILSTIHGDIYTDQFLIYIDNSITNFQIDKNTGRTNLEELNQKLDDLEVDKIRQWLPYARPTDRDGDIYLNRYYVIELSSQRTDILTLVKDVELLSSIRFSETMGVNRLDYIPNDPYWNNEWHMTNIKANEAFDLWDIDAGDIPGQMSDGIMIVGISDDAMDWDHPDLIDNIWQNLGEDADGDGVVLVQSGNSWIFDPDDENGLDDDNDGYVDNFIGWDMAANDNNPTYENNGMSHGTSVGGCVSATTNNNTGVASVGWSVKLMPFRCSNAGEFIETGYNGILGAAQMGANVINCSWGGTGGGNQSVINTAYNTYGCIIVASAGNGGSDGNTDFGMHYPSSLNHIISVSASGPGDNFNCWATAGETVDLCAPGESVYSTSLGGGYGSNWGTSFSSPITAGAVALLWSKYPTADQEWVEERIISSTDTFSDMNGSCQGTSLEGMLGSGRLNINKALTSGILPSLSVQDINYQNDSDGDGVFNPGEQIKVKLVIENGEGWADAENVIVTLTTEDTRIAILDNTITFDDPIPAGNSSFTLIDHFLLYSLVDAQLGNILCNLHIQANSSEPYYEIDVDISIPLSLNQYGFPIEGVSIKSSPLIVDLDNNSLGEIYFGSEDDYMYGYMIAGYSLPGFPFEAGVKIQSSPAAGDVDGDGNNEIVFGSHDGKLHILGTNGNPELSYLISGFIIGAPALGDFDGDDDLEIVFTTQNNSSGKLYAIHHTGENMDGFPIDLDERMVVGAAIGDLEGDGFLDIVVTTYEDNIYAINSDGSIKSGFPYVASQRFRSPATLVDLDGDNDLEIVAGNDDGNLYILHHDGTIMTTYDVGDDIRGGISVADINDDGSNELLFVGYDDKIHVWNPTTESELDGWPYDMGNNALSCPLTADLDNDGDLEIITAMKSGTIYIFHHDGTMYNNFPYTVAGNIETTPAIGKLDSDDDIEIIFGTTSGLQVIDIKSESGERDSWKLHRGNMMRTGLYNTTLTSVEPKDEIVPDKFYVSQNYPNPFNPLTNIEIHLAETNKLTVSIFDMTGRLINTLVNDKLEAGLYSVEWRGKDQNGRLVPTGIYIMKVVSGKNSHNQKIAFVK
tara:strand:- start:1450 stop:4728 length:3279 start_codon:yes stop_codon:yes gene_type:complete